MSDSFYIVLCSFALIFSGNAVIAYYEHKDNLRDVRGTVNSYSRDCIDGVEYIYRSGISRAFFSAHWNVDGTLILCGSDE